MKKIIALVALCFAMITVQAATPAPIQEFINAYNSELAGQSADGFKFGKAVVEGNDLVIPFYMDDSELVAAGMGLQDAINMMGGTEVMEALMLQSIFEDSNSEELAVFKNNHFNIVIRTIGTASKQRVNIRIRYQDL